mmetsp:Transcript_821/g.3172  ORF Transcript_821/g.3172 Transcript_821/m.3172 type:complete len:101 (-) Transcript_821:27-329(-)
MMAKFRTFVAGFSSAPPEEDIAKAEAVKHRTLFFAIGGGATKVPTRSATKTRVPLDVTPVRGAAMNTAARRSAPPPRRMPDIASRLGDRACASHGRASHS